MGTILSRFKKMLAIRKFKLAFMALLVVVAILILRSIFIDDSVTESVIKHKEVTLTSTSEYSNNSSLSLIGDVRSVSEAAITTETSGRVVRVNVSLGQQVSVGTILATLENASERASVLQAEGVYDAAVSAAAQSNIGVNQSELSLRNTQDQAISTIKSTYGAVNSIVLNTIDTFFASPNDRVPGLRIDGRGNTLSLNAQRVVYQTLLPEWLSRTTSLTNESDLFNELSVARENVQNTISIIDTFISIFNSQDNNARYTDAELLAFSNTFTSVRATLVSSESSINNSVTDLITAQETLEKAKLSSSGVSNSAADAQVKQALGALRSAQANLRKTILSTPISGTLNSITIQPGDYINSFDQVAEVANNGFLEIITYVSDSEINLISVGDQVLVENKFTGTVTQIAPAVDSLTKKTEVRVSLKSDKISNGDTVRITKESMVEVDNTDGLRVPLTAVKFERENGFVFTVENDTLVANAVTLGNILGNSVEVLTGLTNTDMFVVDARGLISGETVVTNN